MQRPHALLLAAASLLALSGCRDETAPLSPRAGDPAAETQASGPGSIDFSHPTLTPPLVFLEPLGGAPGALPGTFDPTLSPVVELCPAEGSCDAPLARWTMEGSASERVRAGENHYHVNWHTGRTPARAGERYRLRVRLGADEAGSLRVAVTAPGGGRRGASGADVAVKAGQTVPVKFWIQKVRRLTVRLYPGAGGSPAARDTLVGYGERVAYAYAPAAGFGEVGVSVDGREVPASGEVVMDADHLLMAGGDRAVTLPPGTGPLAASARAVLTAADPVEAMRRHVEETGALFRSMGGTAATARLDSVYRVAIDPMADSAALRRVNQALSDHITIISADGSVRIRPADEEDVAAAAWASPRAGAAGARLSVSADTRKVVFWYVNGIFYTAHSVFSHHRSLYEIVHRDAGFAEDPSRFEVRSFYNASSLDPPQQFEQEVVSCWKDLFTRFDLLSLPTFGARLAYCLIAFSNPVSDLVELARQIVEVRGIDHDPSPEAARRLTDQLAATLRQGHHVVFVAESQGNMMVQQALRQVQARPELLTGRACVGVVSLSAPISHGTWFGLDEGTQVQGIVMKHDIVRYLLQNQITPTETQLTREWDGHLDFLDRWFSWTVLPLAARIKAGAETHMVAAYFSAPETRSQIVRGLQELPRVLAATPGCETRMETGEVRGRVTHARTGAAIAGAQVVWSGGLVETSADGRFTARLPVGRQDLTVAAAGFVSTTLYGANVSASVPLTVETVRLVPFSPSPGTIAGVVRDARNANGIAGAVVEVRAGMNATAGAPVATATSGAGGAYRVPNLPAGTYSVRAVAGGFGAGVATGISVGTTEVNNQDVVLAPITDDFTVVLTWGANPRDLDSHLTGPLEAGGRFHVYYNYGGSLSGAPWASLDVDNTGGYGPETITIRRAFVGTYRYSVHDYSNRGFGTSLALANSGARVRIFRGGALLREAFVPTGAPGSLWTVFEMDVGAQGGIGLRMVNTITDQLNPGAVLSRSATRGAGQTDERVIEDAVAGSPKRHSPFRR